MRRRNYRGAVFSPCGDRGGHGTLGGVPQRPTLSVDADEERQFDGRQTRQQRPAPQRRATGRRRIIATLRVCARKAEGHGRDPDPRISMEGGTVHPKPVAQAVAGRVVEWQAAHMHTSTGRLAANQQPRFRLHPHHRPRLVVEFAGARATGADVREQYLKRSAIRDGCWLHGSQATFNRKTLRSNPLAARPPMAPSPGMIDPSRRPPTGQVLSL